MIGLAHAVYDKYIKISRSSDDLCHEEAFEPGLNFWFATSSAIGPDMASRVEYLENLLADREMQEGDIEIESAEEDREEKKGNGIEEAASEEDASD